MNQSSSWISLRFGEFELVPQLRRLELNGVPVGLSSRAMDILCALAERPGEVVSKQELLAQAWPGVTVDEGSVRFHVSALRRALRDRKGGTRYIQTVSGRGYCFVGVDPRPSNDTLQPPIGAANLPPPHGQVVGREETVRELLRLLEAERFVTVVGAGGIGKSTVALLAAHQWREKVQGEATFVDLGSLTQGSRDAVIVAVARALGTGRQTFDDVVKHLRRGRQLLVLDTCEVAIEEVAQAAEMFFMEVREVGVLATSREPLRVEGESVYRIAPLSTPMTEDCRNAQDALRFSAVQLFVQRAAASQAGFALTDEDAPIVGAICRRLDGMALAIELAAGRVGALGVKQIDELLATEFALTWPGRRTAVPRHQTLNATINWSHELLTPLERIVFRRLATFAGPFAFEAAVAIADPDRQGQAEAAEALSNLVSKSLVNADRDRGRYRLLDAARAYGLRKLALSGEEAQARRWHARHFLERLVAIRSQPPAKAQVDELTANIRTALEWAFGPSGDLKLAVELAAAANSFWMQQGSFADSQHWTHRALSHLNRAEVGGAADTHMALASARMYVDGLTPDSEASWKAAYAAAGSEQRPPQLMSFVVLWGAYMRAARYHSAQAMLDEATWLLGPDVSPSDRALTYWILGSGAHYLGDQATTRLHMAKVLVEFTDTAGRPVQQDLGYDLEASAQRHLSLASLLLGDFDDARASSQRAVARAQSLPYVSPLLDALGWRAFMLYLLEEDGPEIDNITARAFKIAEGKAVAPAKGIALAIRGLWLVRSGDLARGTEMTERGLSICATANYAMVHNFVRAQLVLQTLRQGGGAPAADTLAELLAEPDGESWVTSEILRVRGEAAFHRSDFEDAESLYAKALEVATRQGGHFWALRAALSLAALHVSQNRVPEVAPLLAPIVNRFKPNATHPNLRTARDMLADYGGAAGVA